MALSGALQSVLGSPVSQPTEDLEKRQGFFAITGVTEGGNAPRLELRQLAQTGLQWNLFIQSLERFQKADQSGQASYYGVAG